MYPQHRENIVSAATAWKQIEALEAFGSAVDQEHLDLAIVSLLDFLETLPIKQPPVTVSRDGNKIVVASDGFGFSFHKDGGNCQVVMETVQP